MKLRRWVFAALACALPCFVMAQAGGQAASPRAEQAADPSAQAGVDWLAPLGALVERGEMAQAYELAKTMREGYGEARFDLLFGIAAVESGHAGEGVLALERFVVQNADNIPARLQLARGYFLLGDDARAREEFEALREVSLPQDVQATVLRYLDAIRLRESRYSLTRGMYLEVGIGSNSNVNAGVPDANISLPLLGQVLIANSGTAQADSVYQWGLGAYVSVPLQPGLSFYANGQADLRYDASIENMPYDQGSYNLGSGASWINDKQLLRVGLAASSVEIGHGAYVSTGGIDSEWQYQLSQAQSLALSGQVQQLVYAGSNQARNANFLGLALGYRRLFSAAWQPTLNLGLSAGQQFSVTGRDDLVPATTGLSADFSFTPAAQWGVSLGLAATHSLYGAADPLLGVTRDDTYSAFNFAAFYLLTRNLTLRAEASVANNASNISLYSYPRETFTAKVRYEFK